MKVSARNVLAGKAKSIANGVVNAEVMVELPGGTGIVAVISNASVENLGLAVGSRVHGVVKASIVMLEAD